MTFPTEAERQARLHKRAGCWCMEEESELDRLRKAGTKICEGFDKGIFIRSTSGDGESTWAIKLFPYLQALAVFADEKEKGDDGSDKIES
jgi:hypothetical protein